MKITINYRIIFLISLFLTNLAVAAMYGNTYKDDKYGFEITKSGGWGADLSGRQKQIVFGRKDGITEVSVEVARLEPKQKNAQDVAIGHIETYDGWEYIAGRHLGWLEKHGANSGFSVMYNKRILGGSAAGKKIIVQEYYFVKNGLAYVLTLVTDSEKWYETKNELLDAMNSFKLY